MNAHVVRTLFASAVAAIALAAQATAAFAQEPEKESLAREANRGLHVGLGPVLVVPSDGGPVGGGVDLGARYGIDAGPTVIAPGGRAAGYLISSRFVGTAMPTARVTLPVGPLAPFVVGGAGFGWLTNPDETGLALLAGGGLVVHLGHVLGLGAEATYRTITSTELRSWVIGPTILVGSS